MKKLVWGICYIVLSANLYSQVRLTGKVVDATSGAVIPSATIEISGGIQLVSDAQGSFTVPLPPGGAGIRISSIGYHELKTDVPASGGVQVFRLEKFNLFLQPVEIRATRASDQSPFAKTNISKKEIAKNNLGQDLPFLLNQTPSVIVNSDAGNGVGYTGIRIRGTDATRINVTLNGIPYNDAESQGTYFVDLPDILSSASSIQIQRGVGTSTNGAGAFGASINIATNEFNPIAYAETNNSFGSFNTWKNTVKAGTGLIGDHFTVDARVSRISSDGYIDRAATNLQSLYLSTAWFGERSSLRFNVIRGKEKTYQAWNGILQTDLPLSRTANSNGTEKPGEPYDNQTDNYNQDHYQLFFNHRFNDRLSLNAAVFLTPGKGYYEEYKAGAAYTEYSLPQPVIGNDTLTQTDLVRQLWLDNKYYGNVLSLQYKKNNTQLTFGGAGTRYDGKHYGTIIWADQGNVPKDFRYYSLTAQKTDINVYGKLEQHLLEHLDAFADMQYRNVNYHLNGFKDNPELYIHSQYDFFNPKAGIRYSENNWSAYASYAIAHKEPNRDDFEAGKKQQPRPETLRDVELGLERKTSQYSFGMNLFYMNYRDQLILTGKINDVGSYTRTNVPKSYRAGVELQGAVRLNSWIGISANATLSRNKVVDFIEFVDDYDNGDQKAFDRHRSDIALSPDIIAGAAVNLRPFKNAEVNLYGKYVGRQFLDNSSLAERSLHDYYTQDIRVAYSVPQKLLKGLQLVAQVNNLFNRKYEPSGYTYSYITGGSLATENYVFPMAGVNFMGAVNISF